jgi:hypothetical protein
MKKQIFVDNHLFKIKREKKNGVKGVISGQKWQKNHPLDGRMKREKS